MHTSIPSTRMEILLISLAVISATTAEFQIHTQQNYLVAEVGSDIMLPCTITPPMPVARLEVRWFRDLYHTTAFLLKDGREDRQQQNAEYRGRAFLLAGPDKGNLSLSLHQVRLSDAGRYHCFVEDTKDKTYGEEIMMLTVVGLGTPPLVSVALRDSSVHLSCSSEQWFPVPSVFWAKANGERLPAENWTKENFSSGLFHASSTVFLSEASDGHLYCGLKHPVTETEMGVYVAISDDVFPRASPWTIALCILWIISLAGLAVMGWFFYSKQKEKERQLQQKDDYAESLEREIEWRKISIRRESILFDPSTAYHGLLVSPDCRTISTTEVVQNVPQNPERFDTEPCVLGQGTIQAGTHYWETEVLERSGDFWSLGIAGVSVRRTGGQRESPEALIWAIRGTNGGYLAMSTPQQPILYEPGRIQKVGVYLEYDKGKVTFYDVDSYRRLYTFTENFSEPVYPYYYVGPGIAFTLLS